MTTMTKSKTHKKTHSNSTHQNFKANGFTIEMLISEYSEFVMRFIAKRTWSKQDIDDIYQSTILEAIKSFDSFRGESHPKTWLCGIAYNVIRNYAKGFNVPTFEPLDIVDATPHINDSSFYGTEDPADAYDRDSRLSIMKKVYDNLPTDMKLTFNQVVSLGKSYEEAACTQNLPIGTIRSRISRTRQIFRDNCQL